MPEKKLVCSICGGKFERLFGNTETPEWEYCGPCYEEADAMAAAKDRWPGPREFEALRKKKMASRS